MLEQLTPALIVSFLVIYALFIWLLALWVRAFKHGWEEGSRWQLLKLNPTKVGHNLVDLIKNVESPFVFEIAVEPLGREVSYFLAVPKRKLKEINFAEAKPVKDYGFYHPGGFHQSFYLKSLTPNPDLNLLGLDFSRINEIGESATLQFLVPSKKGGEVRSNLRLFISAPSPYQASEILLSLKPALANFRMVEVKSEEFIKLLSSREFNEKELLVWQLESKNLQYRRSGR